MTPPDPAGPAAPSADPGPTSAGPAPAPSRPGEPGAERSADRASAPEELPPPTGTLFVMMLYIMLLAGMWGAIYFEFLGR